MLSPISYSIRNVRLCVFNEVHVYLYRAASELKIETNQKKPNFAAQKQRRRVIRWLFTIRISWNIIPTSQRSNVAHTHTNNGVVSVNGECTSTSVAKNRSTTCLAVVREKLALPRNKPNRISIEFSNKWQQIALRSKCISHWLEQWQNVYKEKAVNGNVFWFLILICSMAKQMLLSIHKSPDQTS